MPIRKRGELFQVDVQVGGHRVRETARTRQEARELEAAIKNRLLNDTHSSKLGKAPKRLFSEALLRWLNGECRTMKSRKKLESHARNLAPYIKGVWLIDSLQALEEMKEAMLSEGLTTMTVNRRLAIGRRVLNMSYKPWKWLDRPLGDQVVMLAENSDRHIYLTKSQVNKLVKVCGDPDVSNMILLAAYTGLRKGELLKLGKENKKNGCIILDASNKSGRPRVIPLPPEVKHIKFPLNITEWKHRKNWEAARKECKLDHVRFHDLRHTYASWLVQAGAPLTAVRDLLGHSNLGVTDRYSHLDTGHLRAAVARISRKK